MKETKEVKKVKERNGSRGTSEEVVKRRRVVIKRMREKKEPWFN